MPTIQKSVSKFEYEIIGLYTTITIHFMNNTEISEITILPQSQIPEGAPTNLVYIPYVQVEGSEEKYLAGKVVESLPNEGKPSFLDGVHSKLVEADSSISKKLDPIGKDLDQKITDLTRNVRNTVKGWFSQRPNEQQPPPAPL